MSRSPSAPLCLALFALLCLIWASTWTAIKIGLNATHAPLLFAGLRFLVAATALLPLLFRRRAPWDRRLWRDGLVLGLFLIALPYGLVYTGEQYTESYLPAVVMALLPLNVAMIGRAGGDHPDRINRTGLAGLALAFGGVVVTLWDRLSVNFHWLQLFAVGLIFCATFSTGSATVYARSRAVGARLVPLLVLELAVGGLALLAAAFLLGEHPSGFPLTTANVLTTLYLALPGSSLAWWIYLFLNQHWGSTRTSTTVFFTPGLAVVFGWALLGEGLSAWVLVGTGLLVGGIALFRRARTRPPAAPVRGGA